MALPSPGLSTACTAALSSLFLPSSSGCPPCASRSLWSMEKPSRSCHAWQSCSPNRPASPAKGTPGIEMAQTGKEATGASSGCHPQGWAWAIGRSRLLFHPFCTQEGELKGTILAPVKEVRNDASRSRKKYLLSMKCQRYPLQCCPSHSLSSLSMKGKLSPSAIF